MLGHEIERLRRGAHIARTRRERAKAFLWSTWWRRAVFALILVTVIATVAWALSLASSAPDTFRATTVGDVEIGAVATDGIIPAAAELASWSPGAEVTSCIAVQIDATAATSAGDLRLYAAGIPGGLGDYLNLTVSRSSSPVAVASGHLTCSSVDWGTTPIVATSSFTSFATARNSFATGAVIDGAVPAGVMTTWGLRFVFAMPATADDLSGLVSDFSATFEVR